MPPKHFIHKATPVSQIGISKFQAPDILPQ